MTGRRTGFTLMEVVIAMSITVVISLAVATVSVALGNLHEQSQEYYEFLQTGRVAAGRLQATLRGARLVTAASSDSLVIWSADVRDLGKINLSEITTIYYDEATRTLIERHVVFPDTMEADTVAALDITLALSQVTDAKVAEGDLPLPQYDDRRVLAANVLAFDVYCDPAPPLSRLVKFRLTVGKGDKTVRTCGGAALRADKTSYVGFADGQAVLTIPVEHLSQDSTGG